MIAITMYFPKNSYLVAPFDEQLLQFQSSGLIGFWASMDIDYQYLTSSSKAVPKVINMDHLSGNFQIWIVSCIGASLVFLIELIANCNVIKRAWSELRKV